MHATVHIKTELPAAITNNPFTDEVVKQYWRNKPVEPYGVVIPGYGTQYPYSVPHVAVRLDLPGAAAFTAVALDEIVGDLPPNLPDQPSYAGLQGCVASLDTACGY